MKDLFYIILVVWVIWRIMNSVNSLRPKETSQAQSSSRKEGETKVDYVPPKKKSVGDDEGEYVDYEEVK
jgi:hypothetical protein